MGQLTQTTAQVQSILNDSDASNAGNTSISDGSDTTATALKKSGFFSLGASSSNAPSTDRSVLISAVRNTSASGEIRYGQIVLTESGGLYWAVDDGGSLSSWAQAIGTTATQTLTNKTLTSPVLTTPQINDSSADHQYIFASADLAADRTVSLPLLGGNDTFVFEAHTQTLTNKTLTSAVLNTGVSGSAILDEDDFASDSATKLATQQSIKAYIASQTSGGVTASSTTTFTNKTINASNNTLSNIPVSATALIAGTGISLSTNTLNVDAAQTGITSLLATDIKIGEDDQTKIDFETADEIHFYAANVEQVYVADNIFGPQSDSDVDLGSTSVRWKDAFVDSITVTGEIDGDSLDIEGNADINGTTNLDAVDIDGAVQIDATVTVGVDDTGYDVKFFGATSGKYMEWDESADQLDVTGSLDVTGDASVTGTLQLKNGATSAGKVEFYEDSDNGTNKVTLIGPASTSDITLTLPSSDGDSGQFLQTNGSGVMSWGTVAAGLSTAKTYFFGQM